MQRYVTSVFISVVVSYAMVLPALAAPPAQPIAKTGACPSGYSTSGKYCVPGRHAKFAIAKNGSCPSGYFTSGKYCLASAANSKLAIPKSGACPSGFYTSGKYCLANK